MKKNGTKESNMYDTQAESLHEEEAEYGEPSLAEAARDLRRTVRDTAEAIREPGIIREVLSDMPLRNLIRRRLGLRTFKEGDSKS